MNTRQLTNPYFSLGWDDWDISVTDTGSRLQTIDDMRVGLMSGLPNPVGFPTVGNNYMLMARQIKDVFGSAAQTRVLLSSGTYLFSEGDIIAADIGYMYSQYDAALTVDSHFTLGAVSPAGGFYRIYLNEMDPQVNVPVKIMMASRITSSGSYKLQLQVAIDDHVGSAGQEVRLDWVSVDNFRVYPAVSSYTYQDAYDDSGVS